MKIVCDCGCESIFITEREVWQTSSLKNGRAVWAKLIGEISLTNNFDGMLVYCNNCKQELFSYGLCGMS